MQWILLPPSLQNKVQNIYVEKNIGMRGNDSVIPESVLNEAEAFPFLPVLTLREDTARHFSLIVGRSRRIFCAIY